MQIDFHYYATYCAAYLAGYSHEESMAICYSAQFVDVCSKTFLNKIKANPDAATTQTQMELMDARTDLLGLQEITGIWASFHFLPQDLYAQKKWRTKRYLRKYRLICGPNGALVKDTVDLAKEQSLQHVGIAMHVLADTWAHMYFAGTPSLVINNTTNSFAELIPPEEGSEVAEKKIIFNHNPATPDDTEKNNYTNSIYQNRENSVMNLGHGRAGHLPDYAYIRYRYLPAWNDYKAVIKDNPSDYMHAFTQLIYAMKTIREGCDFDCEKYDLDAVAPYKERIMQIFEKRQLLDSADWKAFAFDLSGEEIPDFDLNLYQEEYLGAAEGEKDATFLGKFIRAALMQKEMVCEQIYASGSLLAGIYGDKSWLLKKARRQEWPEA